MSEISPTIVPDDHAVTSDADALLELVGHLGAALLQPNLAPVVRGHLQSAHRLALDLYGASGGSRYFHPKRDPVAY